jgi:hypothetical protein
MIARVMPPCRTDRPQSITYFPRSYGELWTASIVPDLFSWLDSHHAPDLTGV